MGNDGGDIPGRKELVREKSKPVLPDVEAQALAHSRQLTNYPEFVLSPISLSTSLWPSADQATFTITKVSLKPSLKAPCRLNSITFANTQISARYFYFHQATIERTPTHSGDYFCCPITKLQFNGYNRFIALWSCGCVISKKAFKNTQQSKFQPLQKDGVNPKAEQGGNFSIEKQQSHPLVHIPTQLEIQQKKEEIIRRKNRKVEQVGEKIQEVNLSIDQSRDQGRIAEVNTGKRAKPVILTDKLKSAERIKGIEMKRCLRCDTIYSEADVIDLNLEPEERTKIQKKLQLIRKRSKLTRITPIEQSEIRSEPIKKLKEEKPKIPYISPLEKLEIQFSEAVREKKKCQYMFQKRDSSHKPIRRQYNRE